MLRRLPAFTFLVAGLAQVAIAAGQDVRMTRRTQAGQEVLIRSFAPFNSACQPIGQATIKPSEPPLNGTIETRPMLVTVGANLVGDAHCEGTRLDGVGVYYRPREGFAGTDHFVLQIDYPGRLGRVRADVDVVVSPDAAR